MLELDNYRIRYQVPVFTQATVFVNNPGDFSDKERLELMNNMVGEFENITGSWGPVGTMYFVRDFMQFETALKFEEEEYDYDPEEPDKKRHSGGPNFKNEDLSTFLVWPEYDFWTGFIQLQNDTIDGR
ncbi:unnamed protein product [Enterobius vermicularis]|uniref:Chromosome partitioning protein ParB n=1 Tax=Enterobius vermicularis TaxID=51028 RepID=A0A0N4V5C8_ENTVE|nr:unnamed protein product [Enterobius vermicularis]